MLAVLRSHGWVVRRRGRAKSSQSSCVLHLSLPFSQKPFQWHLLKKGLKESDVRSAEIRCKPKSRTNCRHCSETRHLQTCFSHFLLQKLNMYRILFLTVCCFYPNDSPDLIMYWLYLRNSTIRKRSKRLDGPGPRTLANVRLNGMCDFPCCLIKRCH